MVVMVKEPQGTEDWVLGGDNNIFGDGQVDEEGLSGKSTVRKFVLFGRSNV
jgi:hypothetical protein